MAKEIKENNVTTLEEPIKQLEKEEKIEEGTIEDFNRTMTIFFGAATGDIKAIVGGRQTVQEFFGDAAGDYNFESMVTERDDYVIDNIFKFKIVEGRIVLKKDDFLSKYQLEE